MGSRDGLRAGPRSVGRRLVLGAPDTRARGAWASCRCRGPALRRRDGHVRSVCRRCSPGLGRRGAGGGGRGRPLTRGAHDSTARRPVSRLIYLCALVPIPGRRFAEQLGIEPGELQPGTKGRARTARRRGGRVAPGSHLPFLSRPGELAEGSASTGRGHNLATHPKAVAAGLVRASQNRATRDHCDRREGCFPMMLAVSKSRCPSRLLA
jgi:hypothetical protein